MPRLFTGLEIPREIAQSLSMLRGGLPGARTVTSAVRGKLRSDARTREEFFSLVDRCG